MTSVSKCPIQTRRILIPAYGSKQHPPVTNPTGSRNIRRCLNPVVRLVPATDAVVIETAIGVETDGEVAWTESTAIAVGAEVEAGAESAINAEKGTDVGIAAEVDHVRGLNNLHAESARGRNQV